MKELITRSISGLVYAGLFIGTIYAPSSVYIAFIILINFVALYEGYKLLPNRGNSRFAAFLIIFTGSLFLGTLVCFFLTKHLHFFSFSGFMAAFLVGFPYLSKRKENMNSGAKIIFLVSYISFALFLSCQLHTFTYGTIPLLLAVLLMIWINDSGAYLVGSAFGKHKMFPKTSPKKSWEGFAGGIALTVILSFVLFRINQNFALHHWFIIGLISSLLSVFGDLFESKLKRLANKKDSGKIIPGHGGILDRIDSFLFVIPVVYFYAELFIH